MTKEGKQEIMKARKRRRPGLSSKGQRNTITEMKRKEEMNDGNAKK